MAAGDARLVLVGADHLFWDCLRTALAGGYELAIVDQLPGEGIDIAAILRRPPDLVLVDVGVGEEAVVVVVRGVVAGRPTARVLLLGASGEEVAVRGIEAGASGYLSKEATLEELSGAISEVLAGRPVWSPALAYSMFGRLAELCRASRRRDRLEALKLTPREIEILGLVADGLSNRSIGERLSLSLYTVKNHVHHILAKLEVRSRGDAVEHAHRMGWLREGRRG